MNFGLPAPCVVRWSLRNPRSCVTPVLQSPFGCGSNRLCELCGPLCLCVRFLDFCVCSVFLRCLRKGIVVKRLLLLLSILVLVPALSTAKDLQPPVKWHKVPSTSPLSSEPRQDVVDKDIIAEILAGGQEGTPAELAFSSNAILFDYGSPRLRPESHRQLMEIAAALKDHRVAAVPFFFVDGHTCSIGTDQRNCQLSLARARSVVQFLVEKGAVPKERLRARGFGRRMPTVPNDSEENRKKNRRVVLKSGFLKVDADDRAACKDEAAQPTPAKGVKKSVEGVSGQ